MILKELILENYCLFSGPHKFDLEPRIKYGSVRPIILFGGKNGTGKTTFLSAIQLAFYGRQSIGPRVTDKEYFLALRNRIHRNNQNDRRASFAKIGLRFDLVTQGEKHDYYIERSWTAGEESSPEEFFKVERDGKKLEDLSREHLQSFVADIVPERLSQLFFLRWRKDQEYRRGHDEQRRHIRGHSNIVGSGFGEVLTVPIWPSIVRDFSKAKIRLPMIRKCQSSNPT